MDFFEAQEAARKRSILLVGLFALAVVGIIAVVYAVAHVGVGPGPETVAPDWVLLLQVAGVVGAVIAIGSTTRTASLRQGGPAVAELLGGRRVSPDTTDLHERKLVNVVEEMSIASGTPVPAIYVLDAEDGINAFAAGHTTHDAAVAVTRGGLETLSRDELQGVIAHEFAHILNGDMRLNIRLIGVLYGILLLAVIGRGIVYFGPRGGRGRGQGGGGAGWVVILGLAMLLVGYIGVFFGKLIKAAVSRQREYLADSAAVQFTRNPEGLAGALKKIGAEASGSRIRDHHAEELSHLFFANGLKGSLFGFLATHPPLETRIRRLDPGWDGDFDAPAASAASPARNRKPAGRPDAQSAGGADLAGAAAMLSSIGTPTGSHVAYAAGLLERFPDALTAAAHDPLEARALIFALLLGDGTGVEQSQRKAVRGHGGAKLEARMDALLPLVRKQGAEARLPLLDISLPALHRLSPDEAKRFRDAAEHLIRADGKVRTFDFALLHTLARRLPGAGAPNGGTRRPARSFEPIGNEVRTVLSAVAWAGKEDDPEAARAAFEAGARRLPSDAGALRLEDPGDVDITRVDDALTTLENATPAVHRRFLEACADCVTHDHEVHRTEAELLRAISESLDCPMPPVLAA